MGILNGSKCISTISNITLVGLMKILRRLRNLEVLSSENNITDTRPRIDFDMNWLFMNKSRSSESIRVRVDKMLSILLAFAKCGCVCQPICDPENRHHSKRSSVQRRADKIKLEINVKHARYELVQVNQEIQSRRKDGVETLDLELKQAQLSKVARKEINGNEISVEMLQLLGTTILVESLFTENETGGCIEQPSCGLYQADLLLAKRFKQNKSDIVASSDGDFAFLIGDNLVQLKDFHFDFKSKVISKVTLSFASNEKAKQTKEMLESEGHHDEKIVETKHNFFSRFPDLRSRAMVIFGL